MWSEIESEIRCPGCVCKASPPPDQGDHEWPYILALAEVHVYGLKIVDRLCTTHRQMFDVAIKLIQP